MAIQARRAPAPVVAPPPPVEQESLFDYIWTTVKTCNPGFPDQSEQEDVNNFLTRIVAYISPAEDGQPHMSGEQWEAFDLEAQGWFNAAAQAYTDQQELPVPDGYFQEEAAPVAPPPVATRGPAPRSAPVAAAPIANGANGAALHPNPQIAKMMEGKRRKAEERAAAAGSAPVATAPAMAPRGRAPVAAAPAPAPVMAPRGRAPVPAAPAPAPVMAPRGRAPVPAAAPVAAQPARAPIGRNADAVDDLRALVINDPNVTVNDLIAHARQNGYAQQDRSLAAMHSNIRSVMNLIERMGYDLVAKQ